MSSPRSYSFLGAAKRQQDAAALEADEPTTTAAISESDQVSIAARCNYFLAFVHFTWSFTTLGTNNTHHLSRYALLTAAIAKIQVVQGRGRPGAIRPRQTLLRPPGHQRVAVGRARRAVLDLQRRITSSRPKVWPTATEQAGSYVSGYMQSYDSPPSSLTFFTAPKDPLEGYKGYNPKIHGNYDPKADYAQYHNNLRAQESNVVAPVVPPPGYGAAMILNARTGHAQANRPGAEHHNDANKSGRQLNAFFDADAAANAHEGISLKEERQKQTLSKKQVAEFKKKTQERKRKKKMDWLKS